MVFPILPAYSSRRTIRVLFVCQSNAAWSIMAEAILNRTAGNHFHGMSAGFDPAPRVDPMALEQLVTAGLPVEHCFTKSIHGFREDSSIPLDFIISSMDLSESIYSRHWPGNPLLIHWRIPDPMELQGRGSGHRNQFRSVFTSLQKRIGLFISLPIDKIAEMSDGRYSPYQRLTS